MAGLQMKIEVQCLKSYAVAVKSLLSPSPHLTKKRWNF